VYPTVFIGIFWWAWNAITRALSASRDSVGRRAAGSHTLPDEYKRGARGKAVSRCAVNGRHRRLHNFCVMHSLRRTFAVDKRYRAILPEKGNQLAKYAV